MGKSKHQMHHSDKMMSNDNQKGRSKKTHSMKPDDGKKWNKHSYQVEIDDDMCEDCI